MTKKVKRTVVRTIEVLKVHPAGTLSATWCPHCTPQSPLVSADTIAAAFQVSVRMVYQWVESGTVHGVETAGGHTLVCFDSARRRGTNPG